MNNADEIIGKEDPDETDFETQKILTEITAVHAKRYYFGVLKLVPNQVSIFGVVKTFSLQNKKLIINISYFR